MAAKDNTMYAVMFYAPKTHVELKRYTSRASARRYMTKDVNYGVKNLGWEILQHSKDRMMILAPYGEAIYKIEER